MINVTWKYLLCKSLDLFASGTKWLNIVPYFFNEALKYLICGGLPGRHILLLRG